MDIRWNAVLTRFVSAWLLGLFVVWFVPPEEMGWLAYSLPGLVGGFVAGYMVYGSGSGAVHGGLATVVGSLVLLITWSVVAVFFAGILPAAVGLTLGLLVLAVVAIPGAIAGAAGGWVHDRRTPAGDRAGTQAR
jgi:uncharacterized membrane protein YeaQ/YmgE (transglycosylase-associated protein family)